MHMLINTEEKIPKKIQSKVFILYTQGYVWAEESGRMSTKPQVTAATSRAWIWTEVRGKVSLFTLYILKERESNDGAISDFCILFLAFLCFSSFP